MSNSNGFKAQYKTSAGGAWQTKLSGSEHGALQAYEKLKEQYSFARVIDSDGRTVV